MNENVYNFNAENNNKRFIADPHEYKFNSSDGHQSLHDEIENNKNILLKEGTKKYMPIGSIVKVKDFDFLCMIIGYNYKSDETNYDYLGCCYPCGLDYQHEINFFNHEQILATYHIGYINPAGKYFRDRLDTTSKKGGDQK